MPETHIEYLPKSEVKISFTISTEEAKPYLDEALKDISTAKPIQGFRPGKASYDDVKREYGEMRIWETALERIVRAFYIKTVLSENIETVGSPAVSIDQLTPGQAIKFTTITPTEPKIIELPDLEKCKVLAKEIKVTDDQVNETVEQMRKMRRKEALVSRPATGDDLVVIDLEMQRDHVVLEGGTGRDYKVYLAEHNYIPGLTEKLQGIKEGEERTFTLPFPSEHYQKHLAGKDVDFTAKAKGVYELQLPAFDDEFAKGVGVESAEKLRDLLKTNLGVEAKSKSDEAAEIELLDKLTDQAKFDDIPELLVNEEIRRMMHEIEHGVEDQGMKWEDYLASIKKTADALKLEFVPQAMRRIKAAVLVKQLAKKEGIKVTEEELDTEIDRILNTLKPEDTETRERVASPEYRDYVAVQLRNRRTLEWLKEKCITTK
ncbi:MAG: trigger factor [Patescibacteria group bacterium]